MQRRIPVKWGASFFVWLRTPEMSTPEMSTAEMSTAEMSTPEMSTPEMSTAEMSSQTTRAAICIKKESVSGIISKQSYKIMCELYIIKKYLVYF